MKCNEAEKKRARRVSLLGCGTGPLTCLFAPNVKSSFDLHSTQGHAEATFYLAQAYRSGSPEMGLPQDLRAFGELIQRAAADGSSDALFALGGAFFHGEDGFARDPRAAFRCAVSAFLVIF